MAPLTARELDLYLDLLELDRAGLTMQNLATLNTIIAAHVDRLPFQAIDTFAGDLPLMDDDSVFRKVIVQRRGGFCFELNNVLGRLLLTLGFKFHLRGARIRWGRPLDTPVTPLGHVLLCVDLGDKEGEFFTDVGFGGPNPFKALPIEGDADPYRMRKLDGEDYVEVAVKSTGRDGASAHWRPVYHVFSVPQKWIDFVPQYWYVSLHPQSLFRNILLAGRFTNNSWVTLVNGRLCRRSVSGRVEERRITNADEVLRVLESELMLKLNSDKNLKRLRLRIQSIL
ncbi:hypothetical protein V5799_027142 [Amblyomma americanum]|uniref:arylamine N-acetyltransferase n=1 Tax=Amblyomma americanum TaxID=6943 RepID=A0AAQ4DGK1_AMBAM